jgi:hypothetical protein
VNIEEEYVYPLLKSSDVGGKEKVRPKRVVIVPQKRIGEDTALLAQKAPALWKYLTDHSDVFAKRKSSIYEKQPPFSIFGIGDYSFSRYKVAISGMYKQIRFRAVGPVDDKPVMFDDTCYFIACTSAQQAAFITSLLNDPLSLSFIHSIVFWDAKRPITKKLLQRINLAALLNAVDRDSLLRRAESELKQLIGEEREQQVIWPHDLRELLSVDIADNENVEAEVVQLQLI